MFQIQLKPGALSGVYRAEGISRAALSRRMGVDTSTAFRVEKGDVGPSPKFIAALIGTSGKGFDDLFEVVRNDAAGRAS